jgi:surface antigen
MSSPASRLSKSLSRMKTVLPVAALALAIGVMTPVSAFAQHGGGGGGGHGGGGGGGGHGGGGSHGGGGFHGGGGWHGGGWGRGGWGRGGWGWGGFYGGFYPWYGYGYGWDGSYNPFWAYGPDDYYGASPAYAPDGPEGYGPETEGYGPQAYGPQSYGPQSQYYPPTSGPGGLPSDNNRGFYTWRVGVESGTCNRPYIQQIAVNLTGSQPSNLQVGAQLGGIPVQRVIGGRIGPRLDVTDQACATEALEHAPIGTTVRWQTTSGIPVTFVVTKSVNSQTGQSCRDYEATAQFASHTDTVRNTACKGTDGAWRTTR